nr:PREDICTED: putative inorganic phosphate cotransporter isoform X2 [Bemisia tabaci]
MPSKEKLPLIIGSASSVNRKSCCACFSQRYILAIMGCAGVANALIMRACLSITITQMVRPSNHTSESGEIYHDPDACPALPVTPANPSKPVHPGEFDWDEKTQGKILSAFYYGYIFTHIPGGLLSEKFGGKYTLGLGIFSTAIFTLLTPWAARMGSDELIALRFIEGLGEGTTFPALCTLLAQWAPPLERSKLSSIVFAGVQIGNVMANSMSSLILEFIPGGWPWVFYIFGGVGMVWCVLWCLLCYNDPSSHPYITEKEKRYLQETIGQIERKKDLGPMPWKAILTSGPVWALIIAEVGHDWGLYTMVTDLPKYMNDVMHFSVAQNGILSSLPYLVMWVFSISTSALADWLLKVEYMSITTLRRSFATLGAVVPGLGCLAASYVGCDKVAVSVLFTAGMGFMGFCYASLRVNSLDLSPNYSGTIMALVNGIGCISGMGTPYIVGILTPNRSLKEWRVVFWIMFVILTLTNFVYIFYGTGEVQPWNDLSEQETSSTDDKRTLKEKESNTTQDDPEKSIGVK